MSDEPTLPPEDPTEVTPAAAADQSARADPQAPAAPEPVAPAQPQPAAFTPPEPATSSSTASAAQRPEVAVGAAFAGGFLAALILKRLAR